MDVAPMLVLSADIFGYSLEGVDKGVSLLVVAAVEDVSLEVGAVSFELDWWLSLRTGSTTTATATLVPSTGRWRRSSLSRAL